MYMIVEDELEDASASVKRCQNKIRTALHDTSVNCQYCSRTTADILHPFRNEGSPQLRPSFASRRSEFCLHVFCIKSNI